MEILVKLSDLFSLILHSFAEGDTDAIYGLEAFLFIVLLYLVALCLSFFTPPTPLDMMPYMFPVVILFVYVYFSIEYYKNKYHKDKHHKDKHHKDKRKGG